MPTETETELFQLTMTREEADLLADFYTIGCASVRPTLLGVLATTMGMTHAKETQAKHHESLAERMNRLFIAIHGDQD